MQHTTFVDDFNKLEWWWYILRPGGQKQPSESLLQCAYPMWHLARPGSHRGLSAYAQHRLVSPSLDLLPHFGQPLECFTPNHRDRPIHIAQPRPTLTGIRTTAHSVHCTFIKPVRTAEASGPKWESPKNVFRFKCREVSRQEQRLFKDLNSIWRAPSGKKRSLSNLRNVKGNAWSCSTVEESA